MSAASSTPEASGSSPGLPTVERVSWRAKLGESWPLLLVGSGCVIIAVALAIQRTAQTVGHVSPSFLFLAVGITGIAGGLASFVAGPDEDPGSAARTNRVPTSQRTGAARRDAPLNPPTTRLYGRPAPDVVSPEWSESSSSIPSWSEEAEVPPSLLLDAETYPRPSRWKEGRVLRLSEDGVLTVYSVDEALRDLDLVNQIVHGRRITRIRKASDGEINSTD
jgi:hypothetical protein